MLVHLIFYIDTFFWFFAIAGTILFLLRFMLMFVEFGEGLGEDHHADADFKMLSTHSMTGFFMMFGWSGLAALHQFHLPAGWASLVAFGCGLSCLFVLRRLFRGARRLVSRGRSLNYNEAVGKCGHVYQRIPARGTGKIIVTYEGFQHEMEAVSVNAQEIPSFTQIEVVRILDGHKAVVIQK